MSQADALLRIEVIRAWPDKVWQKQVSVPPGAAVQQALQASGLFEAFPELQSQMPAIGIYGRQVSPEEPLADGDRIELYRPLHFDPKESRRRRAAHRLAERQAGKAAKRVLRGQATEVSA